MSHASDERFPVYVIDEEHFAPLMNYHDIDVSAITRDTRDVVARVFWGDDDAKADALGNRVAAILQQAPAMYELLKQLEWEDHDDDPHCACCNYYVGTNNDHASDCRLAAILKAVEGTQ